VKAFDKIHMVRAENSGYSGSKYSRWTSGSRLRGASNLPSTNAEYKMSLAVSSVICVFLHNSTLALQGLELPLDSVHAYRERINQVEALGVLGQDRREHP
jgi:hypothetical protein